MPQVECKLVLGFSHVDTGVVRDRHKDFRAFDGIMPKTFKEISD